jgi:hypothetical protein
MALQESNPINIPMDARQRYVRRASQFVIAVQVDLETDGFTYEKWGGAQTCKRGDWLVIAIPSREPTKSGDQEFTSKPPPFGQKLQTRLARFVQRKVRLTTSLATTSSTMSPTEGTGMPCRKPPSNACTNARVSHDGAKSARHRLPGREL